MKGMVAKIGIGIGLMMLGACGGNGGGGGPDTQAPTVSITSPSSGDTVWGPGTVRASASDNVGIVMVSFYANNTLIGYDMSEPYEVSWDAYPGSYTLKAEAEDTAGNKGISSPVSVIYGVKDTVSGRNDYDAYIYDYSWTTSTISFTGSSDWWVEKVDVELYLYHTYPTDLYIDLESPQGTYGLIVDQTLPPDPDWVYLTKTFESEFEHEVVVGDWILWIGDGYEGDEGYLNWWAITIYCCNTGGPAALAGQKEEKVIRIEGRPGKTGHGGRAPMVISGKGKKK